MNTKEKMTHQRARLTFATQIAWTKDTEHVAMILVGNKADLVKERQVPQQEGREVAAEFKCPFLETSAKTGENVAECMRLLFLEIGKLQAAEANS